jgi:hypothetical protein
MCCCCTFSDHNGRFREISSFGRNCSCQDDAASRCGALQPTGRDPVSREGPEILVLGPRRVSTRMLVSESVRYHATGDDQGTGWLLAGPEPG